MTMTDMQKPHAVAELIDAVKLAKGWSDTDIVDQASKRGLPMSKSNISRLRVQEIKAMKRDLARALAAGLDVPVSEVIAAFLLAMALPSPGESMSVEDALRAEMYPQQVRVMILRQLEALREGDPDDDPIEYV